MLARGSRLRLSSGLHRVFRQGLGSHLVVQIRGIQLPRRAPNFRSRRSHVASDQTITGVAERYASALFELAKDQGKQVQVEQDLVKFQGLLDVSEDLRHLVTSPVFSAEAQGKAVAAVAEKAGISGLAANFFKVLASNRRLFAVSDMVKSYRAIAARARGEVSAEVASARPLSDAQLQALKDQLKAGVGKDVSISAKVDPSLLGGLVVKVGSKMIDSSLKTKLEQLKVAMKGTG
jgi:F-type H+-transporting ATPase subunit delta